MNNQGRFSNYNRGMLVDINLENLQQANDMVDSVIASCVCALRSTVHRSLGVSPGAIIFGRDMMLNIPVVADWEMLRQRRQAVMDCDNARENRRRHTKDYVAGDEVLIIKKDGSKLSDKGIGPFTVHNDWQNGTVSIIRRPGVYERINVRRIKPYRREEA